MIPYERIVDVTGITEAEWLELRKRGIGGSEVAGILGMSQYQSPLSIYMDKLDTNQTDESEENEFIEWGKTLEPIIRSKFPKKFTKVTGIGISVREEPHLLVSIENPFMLANIDGLCELESDYKFSIPMSDGTYEEYSIPAGVVGGIEIKTGSGFTAKNWKDNSLPDNYFLQTQHYMAVTGLSFFFVVALIDKTLLWRYVPRDEEIIKVIIEAESKFWNENVLAKNPPPPIGSDVDTAVLKAMYPQEWDAEPIDLNHMEDKRLRFKQIGEEIKILENEKETIKQEFMSAMKDKEIAYIGDKKITWKLQNKKEFVVKASSTRVMRIG
jgi:putative phage-type endonuclease